MIRKEEAKEKKTRDYIHCIKIKQKEKRERDFDWNRIKLYTEDVLDGDIIGGIRVSRCNLGICESWFVSLSLSWSFDWRRNSCADWRTDKSPLRAMGLNGWFSSIKLVYFDIPF